MTPYRRKASTLVKKLYFTGATSVAPIAGDQSLSVHSGAARSTSTSSLGSYYNRYFRGL